MICCLGGVYISDFLDFIAINACLLNISYIPVDPEESPLNFPALKHLFCQNIPFKVSFRSARRDVIFSNRYNNHRAVNPYLSSIHNKLCTDIHKSYSIALPRCTLRFVRGLFLAALGYATRKHNGKVKGRQVNDPSALLLVPNDSGAINSRIYRQDPVAIPLCTTDLRCIAYDTGCIIYVLTILKKIS